MKLSKEDMFDDDDLMGQPIEPPTIPKKKDTSINPSGLKIPDLGISMQLDDETMRRLQKKDVLSSEETYDTELGVSEKNVEVSNERFRGEAFVEEIPIIESPKEMLENLKNKPKEEPPIEENKNVYTFIQDEENPIPTKSVIKDISEEIDAEESNNEEEYEKPKTINIFNQRKFQADDLDDDDDSKEYISRHDTIYSEKRELEKYKPIPPKVVVPEEEEVEISETKNAIAIVVIVILGLLLSVGTFFFIKYYESEPTFKYELTEEDRTVLTEEYFFISNIEEYLTEINKIVDKEKTIIDNYISDAIDEEKALSELNTILLTKENLKELYSAIKPIEEEVIETKKLSDKIINNTIAYTKDAIDSINNDYSKAKLVANFNVHINENNSNIYMYNQYVISVFSKRNITITYDGTDFAMDTKWLDEK